MSTMESEGDPSSVKKSPRIIKEEGHDMMSETSEHTKNTTRPNPDSNYYHFMYNSSRGSLRTKPYKVFVKANTVLKGAQEDAACIDVLVCGTCHYVFHFIEAFQEHKKANECGKPTFKANLQESKPQVWAFLLWKSSVMNQHKTEGEKEPINSWKLYQRWCKMADNERESWIAAGKAIQSFSVLANAKIAEIHNRAGETKPRVVTTKAMPLSDDEGDDDYRSEDISENDGDGKSQKAVRKIVQVPEKKDEAALPNNQDKEVKTYPANKKESPSPTKSDLITVNNEEGKDVPVEIETATLAQSNKENEGINDEKKDTVVGDEEKDKTEKEVSAVCDPLTTGEGAVEIKVELMSSEEDHVEAAAPPKPMQRPGTVKRKPLPNSKPHLNKDGEASSEDEYVVEKILAKRFNPKRKYYEYLLKWEGYPHDQNTWEPVENMAACDKLVETFERNLARQKAMQQKAQQTQQKLGLLQKSMIKVVKTGKPEELSQPGPSGVMSFEGRPVRSSKKRALEQVKSWCGSMAKKEFEAGKRKAGEESDSDDDVPDKKIKLEPPDDDWSGGEMLNSSDDDSSDKKRTKMLSMQNRLGVVHKPIKTVGQFGEEIVKRGPGRPPKRPSGGTVNGMNKTKSAEKDLAVELGLASDSSPEHKSQQPPVLVANSKGVIKVDPRQVPNLTSGVYIVSNKSGIVKLNDLPSPMKGKLSPTKVTPQGQKPGPGTGIVRKPVPQAVRTPLSVNSGLVRVTPPGSLNNKSLGNTAGHPSLGSRILSPRPLLAPRPSLSMLAQRPGLMQSTLRPGLQPRLGGLGPLRPSVGSPGLKRSPLGVPGVLRPKAPVQSPLGRGMIRSTSPAAQVKSGVKPIHAMLGKAVQNYSPQKLLLPKKPQPTAVPTPTINIKPGVRVDDPKLKKPVGRGRGTNNVAKQRDSKLVESDGLHMEFQEVHSSSDSDDGFDSLPELPMGDLPSLEPDSPPRPFTLCPETGKILGQAEGEPTPAPSPEPEPQLATELKKEVEEAEEILPDKKEGSPIRAVEEESSSYATMGEETMLKVEMSPGGTTGTVIESSIADPSAIMDTLRTEAGLTVTKISTTNTSTSDTQVAVPASKIGVPARKLFVDTSSNSEGASSADTAAGSSDLVTITGEDGVVYQIATEEEQEGGGTMLVSTDGEQQCVYVTAEQAASMEDGSVLTLDTAVAEAVAQLMPDQVNVIGGGSGCSQFYVKEGDSDSGQLMITSGVEQTEETTQAQVVAQVVQEGEPMSGAGGTRRVVLLLPDGNLMMTEVDEEQYAALELDK